MRKTVVSRLYARVSTEKRKKKLSSKFKSVEDGYVFDCSDYRQADKYVTNMKRIAE